MNIKNWKVTYEHGNSLPSSVAHIEEPIIELDNSHKNMLEMINDMT